MPRMVKIDQEVEIGRSWQAVVEVATACLIVSALGRGPGSAQKAPVRMKNK